MKIPVSWLREFVEIPEHLSGREVSELLLSVGFEVEGVDTVGDVRGPWKRSYPWNSRHCLWC